MRLFKAIKAFFKTLFDGEFAARLFEPAALPPAGEDEGPGMEGPAVLLSLLQREGRLVDFLREDIGPLPDDQIGAAARTVHEGCRKVLEKYVRVEAIRSEEEGKTVEVPAGFDPSAIRLSGRVTGDPPFRGVLRHHGWRIAELALPARPSGHSPEVVAPAEVEIV